MTAGMRAALAALVLGLLGASVALGAAPEKSAGAAAAATLAPSAVDLFNTHCGICHLEMGPGTLTLGQRLGQSRALLTKRHDLTADYVKYVVRNGVGSMPPQTRVDLTDAELDNIAAYLTQRPGRHPPKIQPGGRHG
jgi:mono/diheme cytochrome c family protein